MELHEKVTIRLFREEKCFGPGMAELLERVEQHRSLRAAAISMNLAYSKAWTMIQRGERELGFPLLVQGLSMIAFILSMRKYPSKSLNVVVFSAIAILFQFAQSLLTMLGIFEQMLRMRERALPKRPA